MADEDEYPVNLLDYPPEASELQHWKGSGQLRWRDNSWDGDFVLSRLLNGRLRFIFKLQDWRKSSDRFVNLYPLEFEGVAEDDSVISVMGIHFNMRYGSIPHWICTGYAHNATRRIEKVADTVSVRCDLTNYSLHQRMREVQFQLAGFDISIERLGRGKKGSGIEEHAVAYHHAALSTCLKIENIPLSKAQDAVDCLQEIATLLSIACRGHVFITARHIWNQEKGKFDSLFEEPAFLDRRWGRPLIPTDHIEDFLIAAFPADKDRVEKLELAFMTDHYLQGLTIRSIWPQSVSIFTAMETLKTAFFNQNNNNENATYHYWIVPPEDFESNVAMVNEILEVLTKHFSRFGQLTNDERRSLKDQIRHSLKRRSYKTQLKRMLDLLSIDYTSNELQFFVNTRNRLIHEGTPVPASTSLDEYYEKSNTALVNVKRATSLFEQSLLAYLSYQGPRELYDQGLN